MIFFFRHLFLAEGRELCSLFISSGQTFGGKFWKECGKAHASHLVGEEPQPFHVDPGATRLLLASVFV